MGALSEIIIGGTIVGLAVAGVTALTAFAFKNQDLYFRLLPIVLAALLAAQLCVIIWNRAIETALSSFQTLIEVKPEGVTEATEMYKNMLDMRRTLLIQDYWALIIAVLLVYFVGLTVISALYNQDKKERRNKGNGG